MKFGFGKIAAAAASSKTRHEETSKPKIGAFITNINGKKTTRKIWKIQYGFEWHLYRNFLIYVIYDISGVRCMSFYIRERRRSGPLNYRISFYHPFWLLILNVFISIWIVMNWRVHSHKMGSDDDNVFFSLSICFSSQLFFFHTCVVGCCVVYAMKMCHIKLSASVLNCDC